MTSEVDALIQLGHDITSFKYYTVATTTILSYDYLLTLEDEIKYAWSCKKSWIFWLFVFNRYFPMTYQFWVFLVSFSPHVNDKICDKTAFYSIFMAVVCNLLAQVVLTIRIYAVTMKNALVTIGFVIITISQFAIGMWMVVLAVIDGASDKIPHIPLDAYLTCAFTQRRNIIIAYTSIGVFYDVLVFSATSLSVMRARKPGLEVPRLLVNIVDDAIQYFLVIFASHFVLEMTLNLGQQEAIQLLPGPGIIAFLPVMVSRIMLSLRKAADSQGKGWTLMEPPAHSWGLPGIGFLCSRLNPGEGDVSLDANTALEMTVQQQ